MSWSSSRARVTSGPPPHELGPVALVCVYRKKNAGTVSRLVADALSTPAQVYLWALDEVDTGLASHTVGVGRGDRLDLLNRLLDAAQPRGQVVVVDDDVSFQRGDLRQLLELAWLYGIDVAQPAHARGSHHTHPQTGFRPGVVARLTRFVEVGPLVVISARARERMIPFPVEYGMGWGLDVVWSDLVAEGFRLGIVDAVRIMHHGPVGTAYSTASEEQALQAELEQRGLTHVSELYDTLAVFEGGGPGALLARLSGGRLG